MRHTVPLPRGWAATPLDDLGVWSGGGTPSKEEPRFWNGGRIPWVSPKDMKRLFIQDSEDHITEAALGASAARLIPAHSVLMVTRSGILAHTFPVAVNLVPVTVNQDLKTLTPHAGVREMYVAYGLQALGQSILRACSKDGTTVASVDTQELKRVELPVAPHHEQQRIVEAIESYLTRLDNAVALLERVEENLKRYRASVLKAAVEGRLVPTEAALARQEGRAYEPACELLERILAERKTRWIEDAAEKARKAGQPWTAKDNATILEKERAKAAKQYKEPAAPDTTDLPDLPEGWCWAGPEQVSSGEQYAIGIGPFGSNLLVTDYTDSGVPLVFVRNIRAELFGTEGDHYISAEKAAALRPHWVEPGDVLITKMGEPPGDACLYPPSRRTAVITADCIRLRLHPTAGSPKYIVYAVRSYGVRMQIAAMTKGVAQKKVSLARFKGLAIPFPPVSEQLRLVSELDRVNAVCEAVGCEVRVNIVRGQRLRQSILKWAFEGKLVEQDPNDEPASMLLERIRAERAATGAPKARGSRERSAE